MNPRSAGILFLVAAALGAFVYFYEIRGEQARQEAEEAEKRLFTGVEPEDVEWIALRTTDGEQARLERREEGGWTLVEPLRFPADEFTADGMASALARLASEQKIEDPQGPEVYGLAEAPPIRFGAGGEVHALRLGDKTPVGGNSYVGVEGKEPVFAVPTYSTTALSKALPDLRDKRILDFDRESIRRIALEWPGGGVTLAKGDEGWRLESPLEARADATTVDELLADLSFLRAEGFVDDPPPAEETGLDEPVLRVRLSTGEGEDARSFEMAVGGERDGDRLVRAAEESLYRIASERLADFPRELVAYRFKQLAKFVSTDATRLEMVFRDEAGEPVTITATRGEGGWTGEPEPIAAGKAGLMISELSRLRADDILADALGEDERAAYGLAPPRAVFRVYGAAEEAGDEGEAEGEPALLAEVHLGELRGDEGVVARRPDRSEVFLLEYGVAEYLPVSLQAFRNRFASEAEPETEEPAPAEAEPETAEPAPAEAEPSTAEPATGDAAPEPEPDGAEAPAAAPDGADAAPDA